MLVKKQMLYVPVPGALRFEKLVANSEILSEGLKQKTLSRWEVKMDKEDLKELLIENNVNYRLK